MGWTNYPTVPNGYPAQGQGMSPSLLYSSVQLNDPRVPLDIRNQMLGAQGMQAAATSMAPHTSTLASGLQGLAGYLGGQQEQQATAAAAPYQQGQPAQPPQPSPGLLASLLRGGSGSASSGSMAAPDDMASQATLSGWGGVGQGLGQAAQAIGRKSDQRLKSDVTRIGALPNGLAVYRFHLEGGAPEVGLMAQEVALLHPAAVWEAADGFLRVDYSKAVL